MHKFRFKHIVKFFALTAALLCGCQNKDSSQNETEESYLTPAASKSSTAEVEKRDINNIAYDYGSLIYMPVELSFDIDGVVLKSDLNVGDKVSKYQVLASLDESELTSQLMEIQEKYDAQVSENQAANEVWQQETDLMKQNLASLTTGTADYELLELDIEEREYYHKIELQEQEEQLSLILDEYDEINSKITKNNIVSPCNGYVMDICITEGNSVNAGDVAIIIGDYDQICLSCPTFYYESEIEELQCLTAKDDTTSYEIEYIPYDADILKSLSSYDTIPLSSIFSIDLTGSCLCVGDTLIIEMTTNTASDVLAVPQKALFSDSESYYVYKDDAGNRIRVNISLGLKDGVYCEVVSDELQEGDLVYVKQ